MLEETTVNGRKATVAYIRVNDAGEFIPVPKGQATMMKIIYDNGDREFVTVKPEAAKGVG